MRIAKKFYVAAAGLVVAVGALVALNTTGMTSQAISSFRNCNPDAIIKCGALSQSELLGHYDKNVGDVKSVYSHYGISRGDIAGTTSEVKVGTVYRDGRVVVDGKTVATGAYSLSRVKYTSQGQPRTVVINGTTYYEGPSMAIFTGPVDAFVMFRNGQFYKAVLSSCGNPLVAVPEKPEPKPVYACDNLSATKLDRTRFRFTSAATAKNGAEIVSYNYDFGDGNKVVSGASVEHTYAKPGTYNVTMTVNIRVNGQIKVVPGANCKTTVKVEEQPKEPVYRCDSLTAKKISRTTYQFTAAATAENGATIESYTFNFGDGKFITDTANSQVSHTYVKPGTYTVFVNVNFKVNGKTVSRSGADCKVKITIEDEPKEPVYKCDSLTATKINRTTFRFTTDTTAENGASVVKYTYNFGDGSRSTTTQSTVTHEYDKPGDYTITVNVTFMVDGKEVTPKSPHCKATVTVDEEPKKPVYKCENLTAQLIKDRTFEYALTYAAEGGATLNRVTYNFGDGTSETFDAEDATSVEHTFAAAGNYTTTATLYFNVPNNGETVERTDTCKVKISITEQKEMCPVPGKEHLPKDSEECKYCEIPGFEHLPYDSDECMITPPELPKTGLDMLIGGGLGLGSITAAGYYWTASRRNLNALLNK